MTGYIICVLIWPVYCWKGISALVCVLNRYSSCMNLRVYWNFFHTSSILWSGALTIPAICLSRSRIYLIYASFNRKHVWGASTSLLGLLSANVLLLSKHTVIFSLDLFHIGVLLLLMLWIDLFNRIFSNRSWNHISTYLTHITISGVTSQRWKPTSTYQCVYFILLLLLGWTRLTLSDFSVVLSQCSMRKCRQSGLLAFRYLRSLFLWFVVALVKLVSYKFSQVRLLG